MKTARQLLEAKGNKIFSVAPATLVYDALVSMSEHRIGALLVLDGETLAGVFSERDYAREVVLKGRTSKTTPVSEVMSTTVITVEPDQTVEECMNLMSGKRIRHLPVIHEGKVLGVLSIGDLVQATIEYQQFLIKQMESYIQGKAIFRDKATFSAKLSLWRKTIRVSPWPHWRTSSRWAPLPPSPPARAKVCSSGRSWPWHCWSPVAACHCG